MKQEDRMTSDEGDVINNGIMVSHILNNLKVTDTNKELIFDCSDVVDKLLELIRKRMGYLCQDCFMADVLESDDAGCSHLVPNQV